MKDTTQQLLLDVRNAIGRAKGYSEAKTPHDIWIDVENIVSSLAFLISPIADLETEYRQLIVKHMEEGDSHAASEAKARASEEYRDWQKAKGIYKLSEEQIKICKKFKDDIEDEYRRS